MSRLFKAAMFGLLLGLAGLAASFSHFAHDIEEDVGLGLLFQLRGVRKAPSDVVVISIDRESSERLDVSDNPDRWPRSLHARLVENLDREGAKVIIFDVYFIEPRSPNEDDSFAAAIRKARNVVLAQPLKASEVAGSDPDGSYMGQHRIVKIVKPIAPLSQAAVATAPFVLPRLPVKVNQYWTFHAAAGDSPTFPVVAFQLYALEAYDEFIRILEKVSPNQAGKLSHDADTAIQSKGAMRLIRDIREIFESDPLIDKKIVAELERSNHAPVMRIKLDWSSLWQRCTEVLIANISIITGRHVRSPRCHFIRRCDSVKSQPASIRSISRVKRSLWDFPRYCLQREGTAFIRLFQKLMVCLLAG